MAGDRGAQLGLALDDREHMIVRFRCPGCGRSIVTQHWSATGVDSEYIGDDGRCFDCTFGAGGRRRRRSTKRELEED